MKYVPGKDQITAEALSCAPSNPPVRDNETLVQSVETMATETVRSLLASIDRLQEIRLAQQTDAECVQVRSFYQNGWPSYMNYQPLMWSYWENRIPFIIVDDLLLYDNCLVIPRVMRPTTWVKSTLAT